MFHQGQKCQCIPEDAIEMVEGRKIEQTEMEAKNSLFQTGRDQTSLRGERGSEGCPGPGCACFGQRRGAGRPVLETRRAADS